MEKALVVNNLKYNGYEFLLLMSKEDPSSPLSARLKQQGFTLNEIPLPDSGLLWRPACLAIESLKPSMPCCGSDCS
ncbi:hypothetical protein CEXT_153241 [Caerostris extrusa]|uniref:YcgL domain-containing protein n=1 Tax=Caerostris extrusa TaxID=172846 RepID=A0AAV4RAT2_CAEEX|nr:hypothetical protein CEXT_153241 [Caerostris extrusa]